MYKFIDRDSEGNIIAIFAREQKRSKKHEKISVDALKIALSAQPLKWEHGYG